MKVITTETKPIKMWLNEIEDGALQQAKNLANLPFIHKHIALMPDCHRGFGMPIGGVMATEGVIIPNAVGVDIGCGLCAVKTSLTEIDTETLKRIVKEIKKVVPVGFNKHNKTQDYNLMPLCETALDYKDAQDTLFCSYNQVVSSEFENALKSIGTLGGGNHFIEIQKGDDGHIWIMIHSGSRNLGLKVANYYNDVAKKLNAKYYSSVPVEHDLAFLPVDSEEGQAYISEMKYCVDYALVNRKLMMERVCNVFDRFHADGLFFHNIGDRYNDQIDIPHNYARLENHYGKNVWVHRKGATSAKKGEIGIIPGSQGTKSYIVEGLGNKLSFNSCSHGAGRVFGRKQAIEELDLKKEQAILNKQNIIHSLESVEDLDEATSCYKDISEVMENQKELTKILVELTPLAVIKG